MKSLLVASAHNLIRRNVCALVFLLITFFGLTEAATAAAVIIDPNNGNATVHVILQGKINN